MRLLPRDVRPGDMVPHPDGHTATVRNTMELAAGQPRWLLTFNDGRDLIVEPCALVDVDDGRRTPEQLSAADRIATRALWAERAP